VENGIDIEDNDAESHDLRTRRIVGIEEALRLRRSAVTDRVRAGLLFMGYSFPDQVPTNVLTINAIDPQSGTAELKACAVSIEKA